MITPEQIGKHSIVNEHVQLGKGSKIWHFCNVYGTAEEPVIIGEDTQVGSYTQIKPHVRIGNHCRLQDHQSIPDEVTIDDFVFVAPCVTFTNDKYPDAIKTINRTYKILPTHVRSYVTIGAGAVILCGITIGEYAQIGMGAVVTKNVEPFAIVVGNPARKVGDIREERFRQQYAELLKTCRPEQLIMR